MEFELIAISAVIALGAFTQGLTGFGLALVSVPLLSLVVDVKMAIPIAGMFGWLVTFPTVWKMRHELQWRTGLLLFAGSLPGSFLGADLLERLPAAIILIAMGIVLLASSIYSLRKNSAVVRQTNTGVTVTTGFLSGALGASVGEPGPPVIAYTAMQSWSADQVKSTLAFFFMLTMTGAMLGFYWQGLLSNDVLERITMTLPAFVIGMCIGMVAYGQLHKFKIDYHQIIHGFLMVIGTVLIVKNLPIY